MIRPIDRTLVVLEHTADRKGLKLEDVAGYSELCSFLSDLDVDGYSTAQFDKADCLEVLRRLIEYIAPEWSDDPMVFHRNCQPWEVAQ